MLEVGSPRRRFIFTDPFYFRRAVKTGARFDFKDYLGLTLGQNLDAQDYGNFHFGALARAAGYPLYFAKVAAGAAQLSQDSAVLKAISPNPKISSKDFFWD